MSRLSDRLAPVILVAALLGVWEGACRVLGVSESIMPAPSAIAVALAQNAPQLIGSAWNTLVMALWALALASLVGGASAVAVSLNPWLEKASRPLATTIQVTPIVAIAPLVNIWAGLEHPERAVAALAAAVAFFPIYSGVLGGLQAADPDLEQLFALYGAGRMQTLLRLRLPSAIPFVLQALKVAAGLSLVGAVVAEFVSGSGGAQGLAWRIVEASHQLQTAKMFAALLVLAVMGAALHGLLQGGEQRILRRWRGR